MATSMWARRETTSWRGHYNVASPRLSLAMAGSCGVWPPIPRTNCMRQPAMTSTWRCGARTNSFGPYRRATSASLWPSIRSARRWLPAALRATCWSSTVTTEQSCWRCVFVARHWTACHTIRVSRECKWCRGCCPHKSHFPFPLRLFQLAIWLPWAPRTAAFIYSECRAMDSPTRRLTRYGDHSHWLISIGAWTATLCRRWPLTLTCCSGMPSHCRRNAVPLPWRTSSGWPTTAQWASWLPDSGAIGTTAPPTPSSPPAVARPRTTCLPPVTPRDICVCTGSYPSPPLANTLQLNNAFVLLCPGQISVHLTACRIPRVQGLLGHVGLRPLLVRRSHTHHCGRHRRFAHGVGHCWGIAEMATVALCFTIRCGLSGLLASATHLAGLLHVAGQRFHRVSVAANLSYPIRDPLRIVRLRLHCNNTKSIGQHFPLVKYLLY